MSWSIEVCGPKADVIEAVKQRQAIEGSSSGIPAPIVAYIVETIESAIDTGSTNPPAAVHVKSIGHRPMNYCGCNEELVIRLVQSAPSK